jgi:hypothetical protein
MPYPTTLKYVKGCLAALGVPKSERQIDIWDDKKVLELAKAHRNRILNAKHPDKNRDTTSRADCKIVRNTILAYSRIKEIIANRNKGKQFTPNLPGMEDPYTQFLMRGGDTSMLI